MTFEADLTTLLKTVCPRVFPDFAKTRTPRPYVTYQAVGGRVINFLANTAPGRRNAEIQVNVWSSSRAEALELSRAIETAMRGATAFIATPIAAAVSDFDADVPVYGCRQDFSCWHST